MSYLKQTTTPKVSVIIPTYNRIEYLMITIDSILEQSFDDFELIIVSDGSTDNTEEVVNQINDERVHFYLLDKNYGYPAIARNKGLDMARGEYLAFCDDDDIWTPNKLETQMDYARKGFDFICTNCHNIDKFGDVSNSPKMSKIKVGFINGIASKFAFWFLHFHNWIVNSSVLVSKNILSDFRFSDRKDYRAVEDYLLWIQMFKQSKSILLNDSFVNYRVHDSNISENLKKMLFNCSKMLNEREVNESILFGVNYLGSKWYWLRYKLIK